MKPLSKLPFLVLLLIFPISSLFSQQSSAKIEPSRQLDRLWLKYFAGPLSFELINPDRETFTRLGKLRLSGKPSGDDSFDAWWNIRHGIKGPVDLRYQLIVINIHLDKGKLGPGHFAFGVRKVGGDAANDFVVDPRAPWRSEKKPKLADMLNLDDELVIKAPTYNLYDWLHTQADYRDCLAMLWFAPATKDQFTLLRAYHLREEKISTGSFRPGRNNCGTLGRNILRSSLYPDQSIRSNFRYAHWPALIKNRSLDTFGGAIHSMELPSRTKELGRKGTPNSIIHPAPNRGQSYPFRALRAEPKIN